MSCLNFLVNFCSQSYWGWMGRCLEKRSELMCGLNDNRLWWVLMEPHNLSSKEVSVTYLWVCQSLLSKTMTATPDGHWDSGLGVIKTADRSFPLGNQFSVCNQTFLPVTERHKILLCEVPLQGATWGRSRTLTLLKVKNLRWPLARHPPESLKLCMRLTQQFWFQDFILRQC